MIKKIGKLIICLIAVLPIVVMADMGIINVEASYSVKVNNPSGAICYDYNYESIIRTFDYDEILDVGYEEFNYLMVMPDNDDYCFVLKSDVIVYRNNYNFYEEKPEKEMYVFFDGAYLYKGPSELYGKVNGDVEVPVGTTLKSKYYDDMWMYVTYNGDSGWIFTDRYMESPYDFNSSLVFKKDVDIIIVDDIYLFDSPYDYNENKTTNKVIKKGSQVKSNYYIDKFLTYCYFIEGDNVSGWTCNEENMLKKVNNTAYSVKEVKVYEDFSLTKQIGTIPAHVFLDLNYKHAKWNSCKYIVSYNNVKGYAISNEIVYDEPDVYDAVESVFLLSTNEYYYTDTLEEDMDLYDNVDGQLTGEKILTGDTVHFIYHYYNNDAIWRYAREYKAWVKEILNKHDDNNNSISLDDEQFYDYDIDYNNSTFLDDTNSNDTESNKKSLSLKEIIIYSVGGAIALSVGAITTIILINKKKKNKKENIDKKENVNKKQIDKKEE